MSEMLLAFCIWCVVGLLMIGIGISAFFAKKPMGFWANAKMFDVTDLKKYNAAVGKLFCGYGIVFIFLGVPMLAGQNSAWVLLSVIGVMAESIALMVIYTIVIEPKYKKKT